MKGDTGENCKTAAAAPVPEQRLLPLDGGQNFRDLGGYRTQDGRHVKWGLLFRSGSMHGLTPADIAYLEKLGICTVCDFRSLPERADQPVNWPGDHPPTVLADDYVLNSAELLQGSPTNWTEEEARSSFAASYPRLLAMFTIQYRSLFIELLAGHAPLVFNCSAGKDRTGIAAALVLTALGVPRATVIEDYTATDRYMDTSKLLAHIPANMASQQPEAGANPLAVAAALGDMKPGVSRVMMAADPIYIEAALAVLDRHPEGADGYLRDELGLGHDEIDELRRIYLE